MKKAITGAMALLMILACAGCAGNPDTPSGGGTPSGGLPAIDESKLATVIPTVYDNEKVVSAEETDAGDDESWQAEVFKPSGGNNDDPVTNGIIKSPYHTLVINGVTVPVYTARCPVSSHSFAWVDVADKKDDFQLDVTLTTTRAYKQCVVLPESRGVATKIEDKTVKSVISSFGSFTYTFSKKETGVTDPEAMPITIMVEPEEPLDIPEGVEPVYIEPGYHDDNELEFTETDSIYVFRTGLHEISSINVPADSTVYLERGAYLYCADREKNGVYNSQTAIHMQDVENAKVLGRGLLDMSGALGGDNKHKHVINATKCYDSVVSGITVINANTWTMCFYNSDGMLAERNLLLGYRTYSDGIMMSECRDSIGRYNFLRTGDDAVEYKGTGWGGIAKGEGNVYEYNDVWTGKARAYGIIYESACDMENMVFRNNTVGFALTTWNPVLAPLHCAIGNTAGGATLWSNINFRNIEIYYCRSAQIATVRTEDKGGNFDEILFENISVKYPEPGVLALLVEQAGTEGTIGSVELRNFNMAGKILTSDDIDDDTLIKFSGVTSDLLTIS